jgi:hypothetical protein
LHRGISPFINDHNNKKVMDHTNNEYTPATSEKMSRQEAIRKLGKYAAATAAGTFLILSPKQAQASSPVPDPGGDPFGGSGRPGNATPSATGIETDRGRGGFWGNDGGNAADAYRGRSRGGVRRDIWGDTERRSR